MTLYPATERSIDRRLERAMECGYLVVSGSSHAANVVRTRYFNFCLKDQRPYVVVEARVRWARLSVNMDPSRLVLTEDGLAEVAAIIQSESVHGTSYGYGRDHVGVSRLPVERVETIAAAIYLTILEAGNHRVEPFLAEYHEIQNEIEEAKAVEREPTVRFYKSGNAFATVTNATDADDFLRECAVALEAAIDGHEGDYAFQFEGLLPQICDVWAKLRGYKADRVFEQRILIAGVPNPEAHMSLMNPTPATSQNGQAVLDAEAVI